MANVLLDTHVFAWPQTQPHRLTSNTQNAIADADLVWVSAVSFFEIAQKARLGKWPEIAPLLDQLPTLPAQQGGLVAALDAEIALAAGALVWSHRDPFDRLIAATAIRNRMTLISADAVFD